MRKISKVRKEADRICYHCAKYPECLMKALDMDARKCEAMDLHRDLQHYGINMSTGYTITSGRS